MFLKEKHDSLSRRQCANVLSLAYMHVELSGMNHVFNSPATGFLAHSSGNVTKKE